MHAHVVYIGKVTLRARWQIVKPALRNLWLALRGYHPSVQLCADSPAEAAQFMAAQEAENALKHAPGSLSLN